jgi:hypothetical protein
MLNKYFFYNNKVQFLHLDHGPYLQPCWHGTHLKHPYIPSLKPEFDAEFVKTVTLSTDCQTILYHQHVYIQYTI